MAGNVSRTTRAAATAPYRVVEAPPWWHVALALVAALIVQTTIAPAFAFRGAVVSWVLLVVIWYAFRTDALRGLLFGLIAGACEDALAPATTPGWTYATGLVGIVAGRAGSSFIAESRAWLVPFIAAATLVRYAVFALAVHATYRPSGASTHTVLWQSALDAAVALVLVLIFPRLRGRYAGES